MPDLNLSPDYFDHRKTKRLQLRLGVDSALYPIRLWAYAAKYHPNDGLFAGYSGDEICAIATSNATSNATSILDALLDGFLESVEGGFQIHDWEEHQGHLQAFHERAKLGAKARWDKIRNLGKKKNKNASSITSSNAPTSNEEGLAGIEGIEGKEKPRGKFESDSVEYRTAVDFYEQFLKEWTPSAKPPDENRLQSWAKVVDAMIRIDSRTEEQIEEICQAIHLEKVGPERNGKKPFEWKRNILSMGTLREKWNDGKLEETLSTYRKRR